MAPEQLRGESRDPRSDIFSLGAVLYEMSTGQRTFPETVPARLTESIQHHAPVPPRAHRRISARFRSNREYALAYVGLANVYNVLPFNGDAEPQTVFPKAREAGGKAVALDPRLSEAPSAPAIVLSRHDWDRAAAEREFKLAIAPSPNDSWAPSQHAEMLLLRGRHAEAATQHKAARPGVLTLYLRKTLAG